jgi:hypothetical protein
MFLPNSFVSFGHVPLMQMLCQLCALHKNMHAIGAPGIASQAGNDRLTQH